MIPERRQTVRRLSLLGLLGVLLGVGSHPVAAQKLELFGQYEDALVKQALRDRQLALEPSPEGKSIEAVFVEGHDIIVKGDFPLSGRIPWTLLNKLHYRTRDSVVAQELLQRVGEPYQQSLIDESERNLRAMFILGVAKVVAVRGTTPDRVGILLVTKDRWSLRLNTSFLIDGVRLDQLSFSFSEGNVAGRNKRLSIDFSLDPGRFAFGLEYYDPRLGGSRHALSVVGLAYFGRGSQALEGGQLQFTVGRPLFSVRTRLGWQANLNFLSDVARFFQGGDLAQQKFGDELVPEVYSRRQITGNLQLTYSDGVVHKSNVSVGLRVYQGAFGLPTDFPAVSDFARQSFLATLPRSESWAGPVVSFELYTARYLKLRNINTFALTEDFRTGPRLYVELRFATHHLGLPSDFFELSASFNHLRVINDNIFDYGATLEGRLQYNTAQAAGDTVPLVNEAVTAYMREVSPRFGPLRLVIYGLIQLRSHDLDQVRLTLGSDSGLRGYAPRALQGNSLYRVNVELRTNALNLWTIHVGGVLFYDGGGTPPSWAAFTPAGRSEDLSYHQDAGVGLRVLIPQFNRDVLRLDLGFPFENAATGSYIPRFSVQFGQAF